MGIHKTYDNMMLCCTITFLVTAFLKIDPDFGKETPEEE